MVVCKYFQQGTCRFGQYCRFEHTNYGNSQNERNKSYGEGKNVMLEVAEEVLASERGGQWLLSCFGPFKEQPCIPGMEDVSPDEVRWEMYQAQKNGTVQETKLQFQQLCQAMSAKKDALKNPTHEMAQMLERLQNGNKDNAFINKSNFTLSSPQLASTSGTNIFKTKTFGASNSSPFSGGFSSSTSPTASIFGGSTANNTTAFGAKPSFGGNPVFGSQPSSIFGGAPQSNTSVFGGLQQNMPSFGSAAQSSGSFLASTTNSPSIFGQAVSFPARTQQNNIFSNTSSTNSVFSVANTTAPSLFANSLTTQTNAPSFGNSTQGVTTLFGGATTIQPVNSIFGSTTAAPVSTPISSTSIFGQSKTTAAFGGAPIFGNTTTFGAAAQQPNFGGPPAFGNSANIFGANATASTFGSNIQTTNSFNALATPMQNAFNKSTFGNAATNVSGALPTTTFGGTLTSTTPTYGDSSFPTSATPATPFSQSNTFATTAISNNASPNFNTAFKINTNTSDFNSIPPNTPFAATTVTTTISNPFASRSQVTASFSTTPSGTTFGGMSAGPFGNSSYTPTGTTQLDPSVYSDDNNLTDDEKSMYIADHFILGKIPLKPPSIELR